MTAPLTRYVRKSERLSWHLFRTFTRGGTILAYCGRSLPGDAEEQDTLPAGRTCESCYRATSNDGPRTE